MISICGCSGRLAAAIYVVSSILSGCNTPVVNPGPVGSRPSGGGPAAPEAAQAYPEMKAEDAVTVRPQSASYYHEVKSGETLGRIAKNYGVTVDELVRANGLSEPDRLQPGQLIYVPGRSASTTK